jgi:hypothetical protein
VSVFEDHAGDRAVRKWHLVEVQFSPTPLRVTTADFDITALSHLWKATRQTGGSLTEVSNLSLRGNALQSGTVRLSDEQHALYAVLKTAGGGRKTPVRVWEAWFAPTNESAIPDGTVLRASSVISKASKDMSGGRNLVVLELGSEGTIGKSQIPRRLITSVLKVA